MKLIKFLSILLITILVTSCQQDLYKFTQEFSIPEVNQEPPVIQFIHNNDAESAFEEANLRKVADYTKIPYEAISVTDFNKNKNIRLSTRVLCIYDPQSITDVAVDTLLSFVAKGGTLVFTKTTTDKRFGFLLGLNPDATMEIDATANGYYFKEAIFPGKKNFSLAKKPYPHKGLKDHNFSDKIKIMATAQDAKNYPLIIQNEIGKGKVIFYNSTDILSKNLRGLMFSNVLNGLQGIPYPIVNVATIFLDDFPSPIYNINKEPIKKELGVTVADYVTEYWWNDMKKLAKEENIDYTAYVTFDYNAYVIPPFTFKEWDKNTFQKNGIQQQKSSWLGRDILANGHELGFHGYNHVSITKDNWKQNEYIGIALNTAIKKWNTLEFKDLPVSYVPPSNIIDSIGISELHKGMPSLRYMQSTYLGNLEEGGNREFDPEPYNNALFGYPRISSGFYLEPFNEFAIESMYLYTGIWTHFVHPDDVYQIPDASNSKTSGDYEYRNANSLPWYSKGTKTGLLDTFKNHITSFKKAHPMSRFLTAKKGSELVMDWRYAYFSHLRVDGNYIVESDAGFKNKQEHFWLLYASNENQKLIDADLHSQQADFKKTPFLYGSLYTIKTPKTYISLPDLRLKGYNAGLNDGAEKNKAFEASKDYFLAEELLMPLVEKVRKLVEENKLREASDLLISHIKEDKTPISKKIWTDLATYLMWQKNTTKIWELLDAYYTEKPTKENAELAFDISKIADYPSLTDREKWLFRQISEGTTNKEVLTSYVDYFNSDTYKNTVNIALERLVELYLNPVNNKNYIVHLMTYDLEQLIPSLNKLAVCDAAYADMATDITWVYANKFHFDKAIAWEKCSNGITQETLNSWIVKSDSFESYKKTDFPFYMTILVANDEKKALDNLQNIQPCQPNLIPIAKEIALAYSNSKLYREALKWSECAEGLSITSKLSWLYELKDYQSLVTTYTAYSNENPEDYNAKIFMSVLYIYMGKLKESAQITANLPETLDKSILQKRINDDINTLNATQQKDILDNYGELLFPQMRKNINKNIRQEEGNSISLNSYTINDRLEPTTVSNILSYNFFDKKRNIHSISATQSSMFPILFFPVDDENKRHDLFGLEYRFKNQNYKPIRYFLSARIERDNFEEFYYHAGAGINFSKAAQFSSFQLDFFPVRSGPGHSLDLYRGEFNNYNEFTISNRAKQIVAFQANYYTDEEVEGLVLGRTELAIVKQKKFSFSPYIEGSFSRGTVDKRDGYPYWMALERLYGGGGAVVNIGNETTNFRMTLDASMFAESQQPNFERYTGNISFRIKNFTTIKGAFEVYTIENFFSNIFQLGIVYDFK